MDDDKSGLITIPAAHSVDETVEKLRQILQAKGVTLFLIVDHSGEAAKVGLSMPNTKLLIFGNPKREHQRCWPLPALPSICR
jgi:uncharacterized protein (DUF302 family)